MDARNNVRIIAGLIGMAAVLLAAAGCASQQGGPESKPVSSPSNVAQRNILPWDRMTGRYEIRYGEGDHTSDGEVTIMRTSPDVGDSGVRYSLSFSYDDPREGMACRSTQIAYNADSYLKCIQSDGDGFEALYVGRLGSGDQFCQVLRSQKPIYVKPSCDFGLDKCICYRVQHCKSVADCEVAKGDTYVSGTVRVARPPDRGSGTGGTN